MVDITTRNASTPIVNSSPITFLPGLQPVLLSDRRIGKPNIIVSMTNGFGYAVCCSSCKDSIRRSFAASLSLDQTCSKSKFNSTVLILIVICLDLKREDHMGPLVD